MNGIPEFDERLLTADAYRFKGLAAWSPTSPYSHLAPLGLWVEYTREDLRRMAGRVPLELWLEGPLSYEGVYCEARVGIRWRPASWWRLKQLQAEDREDQAAVDPRRVAAGMRKVRADCVPPKPQLGEAACHLMDHVQFSRSQALEVAKGLGFPVNTESWSQDVRNGRRRIKGGRVCRYC